MNQKKPTYDEMWEMLSRIKAIIKLHHYEVKAHLEILLSGDIELSDRLFDERQLLDRKMTAILQNGEK